MFKTIPLSELSVNSANDRHGKLASEEEAVAWLFEHHEAHMLKLMEDVLSNGRIFDSPLVHRTDSGYVVYDGNRRVTCLKALADPNFAPPKSRPKVQKLLGKGNFTPPVNVECQVEDDLDTINQIVGRRHNGADGGRGQIKWDTRAQANHAERIGTKTNYPVAEAVESFLMEEGVPFAQRIQRSTLERLLKAQKRQRAFGFTIDRDKKLKVLAPKEEVLPALIRVAEDIEDKKLTLSTLLRAATTDEYIEGLKTEGILPSSTPNPTLELSGGKDHSNTNNQKLKSPSEQKRLRERTTLIPASDLTIDWPENRTKIYKIWNELRTTLKFGRHDIAIAVMFRVLIETVTDHARDMRKEKPKDKLAKNVCMIANELQELGMLTAKEVEEITRFCNDKNSHRGLEALHRVVHSNKATLHANDLRLMWDQMENYIVGCLNIPRA